MARGDVTGAEWELIRPFVPVAVIGRLPGRWPEGPESLDQDGSPPTQAPPTYGRGYLEVKRTMNVALSVAFAFVGFTMREFGSAGATPGSTRAPSCCPHSVSSGVCTSTPSARQVAASWSASSTNRYAEPRVDLDAVAVG